MGRPFVREALNRLGTVRRVGVGRRGGRIDIGVRVTGANATRRLRLRARVIGLLGRTKTRAINVHFDRLPSRILSRCERTTTRRSGNLLSPNGGARFVTVTDKGNKINGSAMSMGLTMSLTHLKGGINLVSTSVCKFDMPSVVNVAGHPMIEKREVLPIRHFKMGIVSVKFFMRSGTPVV